MSGPSGGHAAEQYLPENLRRLRERKGISQAALAKAMSEHGWPWHQQTAYKVENGKQGIGLGEATDLAAILGVSTDRLTWAGPEAAEAAFVDHAAARLHRAAEEAADAIAALHAARAGAELTLEERRNSEYRRVRKACDGLEGELAGTELDAVIDEGAIRWDAMRTGG